MTVSLLGAAAPGFDRPLDVLEACHGRIARQCDTLGKLLAHLPTQGADAQAQQAARAVLTYFDTAAVHHHDDEERNLFPLLEQAGVPAVIPAEMCYLGWQESLEQFAKVVEPDIPSS